MPQIKNALDLITLKKSIKGLLLASTGGAALAGLSYIGTIEFSNPTTVIAIGILVPAGINFIREIMKGEKVA